MAGEWSLRFHAFLPAGSGRGARPHFPHHSGRNHCNLMEAKCCFDVELISRWQWLSPLTMWLVKKSPFQTPPRPEFPGPGPKPRWLWWAAGVDKQQHLVGRSVVGCVACHEALAHPNCLFCLHLTHHPSPPTPCQAHHTSSNLEPVTLAHFLLSLELFSHEAV